MKKNSIFRTFLLSTVFALLAVFLMAPVVSAQTATPSHRAATATSQVSTELFSRANIVIKHGKAVFSPTVIHCNACMFIVIANNTNVDQTVLFKGKLIAWLPPGDVVFLPPSHLNASRPGKHLVGLKSNPKAQLTILSS